MKTVVIFRNSEDISFVVLEGDYSHLNGLYINGNDNDDKLADTFYNSDDGEPLVEFLDVFPVEEVRNGAKVIVGGWVD